MIEVLSGYPHLLSGPLQVRCETVPRLLRAAPLRFQWRLHHFLLLYHFRLAEIARVMHLLGVLLPQCSRLLLNHWRCEENSVYALIEQGLVSREAICAF